MTTHHLTWPVRLNVPRTVPGVRGTRPGSAVWGVAAAALVAGSVVGGLAAGSRPAGTGGLLPERAIATVPVREPLPVATGAERTDTERTDSARAARVGEPVDAAGTARVAEPRHLPVAAIDSLDQLDAWCAIACDVSDASPGQTLSPASPVAVVRHQDDVAYGTLPGQHLDVYLPPAGSAHGGAILFVHGGGWVGGDENGTLDIVTNLTAEHGWTLFSVSYRLEPFPTELLDVNQAMRWVKANAATYGIDPSKVVVAGFSAGGHLATMLATTWDEPTLQPTDLPEALAAISPRPAAAFTVGGPLDPRAWGDSGPAPEESMSSPAIGWFAGCPGLHTSCTAEQLAAIDPSTYADPGDTPVYVAHGDMDGIVTAGPQLPAVRRLQAAIGDDTVWYDLASTGAAEHRNHDASRSINTAYLQRFLDRVLAAG